MKLYTQVLLLLLCIACTTAIEIARVSVTASTLVIGASASYTFTFSRMTNSTGGTIEQSALPSNFNFIITFPLQFPSVSGYNCSSIKFGNDALCSTCSASPNGRNISLSGCTPSASNYNADIIAVVIGNITNPIPAMETSQFIVNIGNDITSTTPLPYLNPPKPTLTFIPDSMNCSFAFDPTTVNTFSKLLVKVIPKHTIPANNGQFVLTFPTGGSWGYNIDSTKYFNTSNSLSCIGNSGLNSQIVCSILSANTISVTNLSSTDIVSEVSFNISNILTPLSPEQVDNISVTSYYNSSARLDIGSNLIPGLTPKTTMGLVLSSPSTLTVNRVVTLQLAVTLADPIFKNSSYSFQLIFPDDSVFSPDSVKFSGELSSSFSDPTKFNNTAVRWQFTNDVLSLYSIGNIIFSSYTVPPTTLLTNKFTLNIKRNNIIVQTGQATLKPVPGTLSASVTSLVPNSINSQSGYTFLVSLTNQLSRNGCIRIALPSALSYSQNACQASGGSDVNPSPTCTGTTSLIQACNLFITDPTTFPKSISITVSNITNPGSQRPTGTFNISSYYNSTSTNSTLVDWGIASGIAAIFATLDLSKVRVTPSVGTTYATSVGYSIVFVNSNKIPKDGIIVIGLPSTILNSSAATCTFFIGTNASSPTTCNMIYNTSGTFYEFRSVALADIPALSTITLGFSNVFTNPSSVANTSSFSIQTFDSTYLIDSLTSGIFPLITSSTLIASLSRNSTTNSAISSYTFTMNQPPPITAGSIVVITFPATVVPQGVVCTDLNSVSLICNPSGQTVAVTMGSPVLSNTNFGVIISNVKNPPSYKPSDTFAITTQTASSSTYSQNSALTVTNNISSTLSNLVSSFDPTTLSTPTVLTLTFTTTAPTAKIIITLSPSFNLSAGDPQCTPTCQVSGRVLTITQAFSTSPTIVISHFSSANSTPTSTDRSSIETFDSGDFSIDKNPNSIQFLPACTWPCRTCTSSPSTCTSCYDSSLTTFIFYYSVNNSCLETCPDRYYKNGNLCSACVSPCANCIGSSTNCTTCSALYPYYRIDGTVATCLSTCADGTFAAIVNSQQQCLNCNPVCVTCTNLTYCLSCKSGTFLYNNNCNTSCPTNKTTIPNSFSNTCDPCTNNCVTCENTTSSCLSCPSTGGFVLYQNACITVCPPPMIKYLGTCSTCDISCKTCESVPTNCTSCSVGNLYANTCINTCPIGYAAVENVCRQCQITCARCFGSISNCSACVSPYKFVPSQSVCLTDCPANLYLNVSDNSCIPCSSPCFTCIDSPTTCRTCLPAYVMWNSQCIETCPAGTSSNGTHCVATSGGGGQVVDRTLNSKIFPLPFTIAGTVVMIATGISKFQNSNTFFSGATYALLSLLEWGAMGAFLTLYFFWAFYINTVMIVIIGVCAILYIINMISLVVYSCVLSKDKELQAWRAKKCTCKAMLVIAFIFSTFISFKFMNFIFCRLYNFTICKAKLENLSKFFSFNFLIFLSTPFSVGAIGVAAYHAYTSSRIIDQLYLQSIDLIIVVIFTFIFGIATSHKNDDFFEEKAGDYTLGKKAHDSDQFSNLSEPLKQYGSNEKGGTRSKYSLFNDGDISQPSMMDLKGEHLQFSEDETEGDRSGNKNMAVRLSRKYMGRTGNRIDEQQEPERMISVENSDDVSSKRSGNKPPIMEESEEESKIDEKQESGEVSERESVKDKSGIEMLQQMQSRQEQPQEQPQEQHNSLEKPQEHESFQRSQEELVVQEQKSMGDDDIILFQERDGDTSRNHQLDKSRRDVLREEVRLKTEKNMVSDDDDREETGNIPQVVQNKSEVKDHIIPKIGVDKETETEKEKEEEIKKVQNNFMEQNRSNAKSRTSQQPKGIEVVEKSENSQEDLFEQNKRHLKTDSVHNDQHQKNLRLQEEQKGEEELEEQQLEEEEEQESQDSNILRSDGAQKTVKATIKTKGLDTSKDNYLTDRGEIGARQIISDIESDFKFKPTRIRQDLIEEEQGNAGESQIKPQIGIEEVEEQPQKNLLLYESENEIEDSLPQGELKIEAHPYHVLSSNKRSTNSPTKTLDAARREDSLDNFVDTFTKLSNNNKNKRLPDDGQDSKITELRSPVKPDGEQGQTKINKHPPTNPMKIPKKEKKMNQLLNSSSEFTESENTFNNVPPFEIQPIPRDNLTNLSKQIESVHEVKKEHQSPPKKFKVVYDTSDVMDEESMEFDGIEVSPSDFNHYNQRFIEEEFNYKTSTNPMSKNDMPQKPQIVMVKSTNTINRNKDVYQRNKEEKSHHQEFQQDSSIEWSGNQQPRIGRVLIKPMSAMDRAPILMRGFSSQGTRKKNSDYPTARDRRTMEAQSASRQRQRDIRINPGLQKIYLQRLDGPTRRKDK